MVVIFIYFSVLRYEGGEEDEEKNFNRFTCSSPRCGNNHLRFIKRLENKHSFGFGHKSNQHERFQ